MLAVYKCRHRLRAESAASAGGEGRTMQLDMVKGDGDMSDPTYKETREGEGSVMELSAIF